MLSRGDAMHLVYKQEPQSEQLYYEKEKLNYIILVKGNKIFI